MLRQTIWKKQNILLQQDANLNINLKQQIQKQISKDYSIQQSINDKIYNLKLQATNLAKNLENQKRKNIQLDIIIKHLNNQITQEKKIQSYNKYNNNQYQGINNLDRKIKKNQYDLDQISAKMNDIGAKVKSRKEDIKAYRTQRVIDSGIFRNLQKQLKQSSTQFKKLLIEKIKYQKQYQQTLIQYNNIKQRAQQIYNNKQTTINNNNNFQLSKKTTINSNSNQQTFLINVPKIQQSIKFTSLNPIQTNIHRIRNNSYRKNQTIIQKNYQIHQFYQFIVKKFLIQTGLKNSSEVLQNLNTINQKNQTLFKDINVYTDRIAELQNYIKQSQQIKSKTKKYYESHKEMSKSQRKVYQINYIRQKIKKVQEKNQQQSQLFAALMKDNNFQKLQSITQKNQVSTKQENIDLENYNLCFQELENFINPILSCYKPQHEDTLAIKTKTQLQISPTDKIEDLLSKMKKYEETDKIMKKQQFRSEYKMLLKTSSQMTQTRVGNKKKSYGNKN